MAKKKTCFIIGDFGATKSRERKDALWLLNEVIEPVISAHFRDFATVHAESVDAPEQVTRQIFDNLNKAELVIANISGGDQTAMYELGVRLATGLPTVQVFSTKNIPVIDLTRTHAIRFNPGRNADVTRRYLREAIDDALLGSALVQPDMATRLSSKNARAELGRRVVVIADAIAELRINAAAEYVEELRKIGFQLARKPPQQEDLEATTRHLVDKVIKVLAEIDQVIGSSKLSKLVLAGAIAALTTGGGAPAAAVFTLSLAVWNGPEAFKAAMEKYIKRNRRS